MIDKRGVGLCLGTALVYGVFLGGRGVWNEWYGTVRLGTARPTYAHDELIDIRLTVRDAGMRQALRRAQPRAVVLRDGRPVTTIAGIQVVPLSEALPGVWSGRWPCPWNAPAGRYDLLLSGAPAALGRLKVRPFAVTRRRPAAIPQGMTVLTLESSAPLETMRVPTPSGEVKDWRGLLDWAEFVHADAFWLLGGQSPGTAPGEVWVSHNFGVFPKVAEECHRRGLKFGLYAMAYLTVSKTVKLPRYEYARDVEDNATVLTRAVSLREPRRVEDVAALLRRFRDIPGVDYLGIDYIRNALGGYELVDEFFGEFPGLSRPAGWESFSKEERMLYLARKKVMRRDRAFIDAWQWWRAHYVAGIVRRLKAEIGDAKPLWAFTLTWDKGWHHGQDPVMMNDAGVDIDALMLYEATEPQFQALVKDWHRYVKRGDVQLLVGDVVDWSLHQRAPEGPRALYGRLARAGDGIFMDGPAQGLFIHDLGRALWGRLGRWSTRQWLDAARQASLRLKAARGGRAAGAPGTGAARLELEAPARPVGRTR